MRRTLYIPDEQWEMLRAMAGDDGRHESGTPLSVSAFVCRLIMAEKRKRSPQVPLEIHGVRSGLRVKASGQATIANAGYAKPSERQPLVAGPIAKPGKRGRGGR